MSDREKGIDRQTEKDINKERKREREREGKRPTEKDMNKKRWRDIVCVCVFVCVYVCALGRERERERERLVSLVEFNFLSSFNFFEAHVNVGEVPIKQHSCLSHKNCFVPNNKFRLT